MLLACLTALGITASLGLLRGISAGERMEWLCWRMLQCCGQWGRGYLMSDTPPPSTVGRQWQSTRAAPSLCP